MRIHYPHSQTSNPLPINYRRELLVYPYTIDTPRLIIIYVSSPKRALDYILVTFPPLLSSSSGTANGVVKWMKRFTKNIKLDPSTPPFCNLSNPLLYKSLDFGAVTVSSAGTRWTRPMTLLTVMIPKNIEAEYLPTLASSLCHHKLMLPRAFSTASTTRMLVPRIS